MPRFTDLLAIALGAFAASCADPIADTWETHTAPADTTSLGAFSSYVERLEFRPDHTLGDTTTITWSEYEPTLARCVGTYTTTGITWSRGAGNEDRVITLGGTPRTIEERQHCDLSSVNVAAHDASAPPDSMPADPIRWTATIRDDRLVLTAGSRSIDYERVRAAR